MANSVYASGATAVSFRAITSSHSSTASGLDMATFKHIFGLPYQFSEIVDPRVRKSDSGSMYNFGAKYAEKILSRMPLLFLVPCKAEPMAGMSSSSKAAALNGVLTGGGYNGEDSGRYYTTKIDTETYYRHVNGMCQQVAYLLGIQNITIPGLGNLGNLNWNLNAELMQRFAASGSAVVFYADTLDSVSESFSNTSMESSLASQLNGYSDQVNEIKFLLGDGNLAKAAEGVGESVRDAVRTLGNTFVGSDNLGGILSDLAENGVDTILQGGKLEFPKLWQDSSYERTYSFDLKFRTPDNDDVSIFLNILVPYIHLLAFVMPQGMDNDVNGYQSPVLCKAYAKGMLSVDMALVSSLTTTKGATCQWNDNGLPTQIDVNISLEDLYSKLHLNPAGDVFGLVRNTGLMDFLCNMAGLNVMEDEIGRRARVAMAIGGNVAGIAAHNIHNKFGDAISNFRWYLYSRL